MWARTLLGVLLVGLMMAPGTVARAQEPAEAEASVYPGSVTPGGGTVTYQMQVGVSIGDLPATITSVSSDLHGDVTDPANPAILSTSCAVPVDWQPDSNFGWALGWGCEFEAWVEGEPGEVAATISATVVFGDETEVVVSDVAVVTISAELGAIHGTLVDSATGEPLAGEQVSGTCAPCGDVTDAEGGFALEGLEPGEYRLEAGNTTVQYSDYAYEWYDDAPAPESATPVLVLPGQITFVEWGLSVGGVIEGTVTDEATGEPLGAVEIPVLVQNEDGTRGGFTGTSTGADGTYRMGGLHTANYVLCYYVFGSVQVGEYEPECWNDKPTAGESPFDAPADSIHVELGETVGGIDVSLTPVAGPPGGGGVGGAGGEGNGRATLPFTGIEAGPLAVTATALVAAATTVLLASKPRTGLAAPRGQHTDRRSPQT